MTLPAGVAGEAKTKRKEESREYSGGVTSQPTPKSQFSGSDKPGVMAADRRKASNGEVHGKL